MSKNFKITLIVILALLIAINLFVLPKKENEAKEHDNTKATLQKAEESTGKALIGGEFELVNQDGKEFTSQDIKGKYSLIFFGFTNCPMVCPTALNTLTLVLNQLGDKAKNFNTIFITTDPERDTTTRIKEYLQAFDNSIIGLTGTKGNLKQAYDAYRVYAKKVAAEDGGNNYDMNHSSIIYVMDKNGEYLKHFTHSTDVDEIMAGLKKLK